MPLGAWSSAPAWLGEGGTHFSFTTPRTEALLGEGKQFGCRSRLGTLGAVWVPRAACLLGREGEGSSRVGGSQWGFPFIPTEGVQGCWGMGRALGDKLGMVWVPLGVQSSVPARLEEKGPLRGLEDPVGNPPGVPVALDPSLLGPGVRVSAFWGLLCPPWPSLLSH